MYFSEYKDKVMVGIPFLIKSVDDLTVINSLGYFGSHGGVFSFEQNCEAMIFTLEEWIKLSDQKKSSSTTVISNPFFKKNHLYKKHFSYDYSDLRISQYTLLPEKEDNLLKTFENDRILAKIAKMLVQN